MQTGAAGEHKSNPSKQPGASYRDDRARATPGFPDRGAGGRFA